jgi:membrane fusion protein, multidrug efflux system
MKSKTVVIIFAVIAVLAIIKIFFLNEKKNTAKGSPSKNGPVIATGYVVKKEKMENVIFASGTILSNEEVELRPEAQGKITQLFFKEGSRVSKGELLVKLNDADLQAQLHKINLQITLAEERENRQKQLLAIKGISQDEFDIQHNLLQSLQADADVTRAQIQKTEIRAPFDGIIGLKSVSEGSIVSPLTPIASLQQIDPVKVDFAVPEKYAGAIEKGNLVFFSLNDNAEKYKGEVYAIDPKINLSTRTLQVRAICPNSQHKIYAGAFVKIEVVLKENDEAIMIPTEAIIPELKGKKVFIVRNGRAVPIKVETGLRTNTRIEVKNGLQIGDTVIRTGLMAMRPDTMVTLIKVE